MAKTTPVRIDDELLQAARQEGQLTHRSVPEQLELWARIGRLVAGKLSAEQLAEFVAGITTFSLERKCGRPVSPARAFDFLESQRRSGALTRRVSEARVRYQASPSHPGLLEQLTPEGDVRLGTFRNGAFVEHRPEDSNQA